MKEIIAAVKSGNKWCLTSDKSEVCEASEESIIFVSDIDSLVAELNDRHLAPEGCTMLEIVPKYRYDYGEGTVIIHKDPIALKTATDEQIFKAAKEHGVVYDDGSGRHTSRILQDISMQDRQRFDIFPIGDYIVDDRRVQYDPARAKRLVRSRTKRAKENARKCSISTQILLDVCRALDINVDGRFKIHGYNKRMVYFDGGRRSRDHLMNSVIRLTLIWKMINRSRSYRKADYWIEFIKYVAPLCRKKQKNKVRQRFSRFILREEKALEKQSTK